MSEKEDTRIPPNWLNEDFLTKALREGLKEPALTIKSCSIKPATAVGDNYASLMFRVQLQIVKQANQQPEHLSVVCKTLPPGDFQKTVKEIEVFEKEAFKFRVTLPAMNKILRDIFPDAQPLCADFIWFGTEPEQIIILQDLKELGFCNLDRMGGLDLTACKLVLRNLAHMHAASLHLLKHAPETLDGLQECLWVKKTPNDEMGIMVRTSLDNLVAEVSEWNDFPEDYINRLKKLQGGVMETEMMEALRLDEQSLNVFQHGDCWINNFMFTKSNGRLTGLRFVDFQMSCMNSAAMDLNYFLFTSPSKDIRLAKIDEMLQYYYDNFIEAVNKLKVELPPFTIDNLKQEFRRRAFFGLVATIIVYPITITESKDSMDVNKFFEEGTDMRRQFQNKAFKEVFKMVFPYFVDCGVV